MTDCKTKIDLCVKNVNLKDTGKLVLVMVMPLHYVHLLHNTVLKFNNELYLVLEFKFYSNQLKINPDFSLNVSKKIENLRNIIKNPKAKILFGIVSKHGIKNNKEKWLDLNLSQSIDEYKFLAEKTIIK